MLTVRMMQRAVCVLLGALLSLAMWAGPVARASQKPAAVSYASLGADAAKSAALPAHAVRYKYTLSRIAWTGSRIVIAANDAHGDLYYFWKPYGTSKWHQELVAKAGRHSGYSHPSIAWTGHAVIIVALDSAGDLVDFTSHAGSGPWLYQRIAKSSGFPYYGPSVTATPTGTVLISVGRSTRLWSFELPVGHTSWTANGVSIGATFGGISITTCYDKLINQYLGLITATADGYLYFWWQRLDIPGWNQEVVAAAGPGATYTSGSIVATANDIYLTAGISGLGIEFWSQPIGGSGWASQVVAPSGGPFGRPEIAWTGPVSGSLLTYDVITATSHTGRLLYWWKEDGGTTWFPESIAAPGKRASYANPAIAVTGRSVIITAINTKPGDVTYWYQPYLASPWHGQIVAVG